MSLRVTGVAKAAAVRRVEMARIVETPCGPDVIHVHRSIGVADHAKRIPQQDDFPEFGPLVVVTSSRRTATALVITPCTLNAHLLR